MLQRPGKVSMTCYALGRASSPHRAFHQCALLQRMEASHLPLHACSSLEPLLSLWMGISCTSLETQWMPCSLLFVPLHGYNAYIC